MQDTYNWFLEIMECFHIVTGAYSRNVHLPDRCLYQTVVNSIYNFIKETSNFFTWKFDNKSILELTL